MIFQDPMTSHTPRCVWNPYCRRILAFGGGRIQGRSVAPAVELLGR